MTRSSKIALAITAGVLSLLVAGCGAVIAFADLLPGAAGCEDLDRPTVGSVIHSPSRIQQQFPQLGSLTEVHWQEREVRARSCPDIGPMDYVMEGFATLTPEKAAALAAEPDLTAATAPQIPADLRAYAPPSPQWRSSRRLDDELRATVLLDEATRVVFFRWSTT